jgi:hypothetical protein
MEEFEIDMGYELPANYVNLTNDSSNPWKYKKGEVLNRWSDNKNFRIVSVPKYPKSTIAVVKITQKEADRLVDKIVKKQR